MRTTVPTRIAGTKLSLVAVQTTLVESAVTTIVVGTTVSTMKGGTNILWQLLQQILFERFVTTNVLGTTVHINSL